MNNKEALCRAVLSSINDPARKQHRVYNGKSMFSIHSVGSGNERYAEGILILPVKQEIKDRGLLDSKTYNFLVASVPIDNEVHVELDDESAYDNVLALSFCFGFFGGAMGSDLSIPKVFGKMIVNKYKGKKKYYLEKIVVRVPYNDNGYWMRLSKRIGNALPREDEVYIYNAVKSLFGLIDGARRQNGYPDIDSIKVSFNTAPGRRLNVDLYLNNERIDESPITWFKHSGQWSTSSCYTGIDFVKFYNVVAQSGIPVYSVKFNRGSSGKVGYSPKSYRRFNMEFI